MITHTPHPPRMAVLFIPLLLIGQAILIALPTDAQAVPQAVVFPQITLTPYTSGLAAPVHLTHAGDGSGRIFVVEQTGRIRILHGSLLDPQPFLDISSRVRSPANGGENEEGLLSVAFPPNYSASGRFYVYYTNLAGNNIVARFTVTADPDTADPQSEQLVLELPHPTYSNHNGGQLAFGPDDYLYIGVGDGGGGGDPFGNAQDPDSLLGKLLRIDVGGAITPPPIGAFRVYLPLAIRSTGDPNPPAYTIPPDNPFVGVAGYRPEIWALGMRNPWRFSFDRANGDLYIGDVGQNDYEEVDFQSATSNGGENYGWNEMEGKHCYLSGCTTAGMVLPVAEYTHSLGCSITGGFIYRGAAQPGLQGFYFFADYCDGRVWGLIDDSGVWQMDELLDTDYFISSFGEDEAGEIYAVDRFSGIVYRLENAVP